MPNELQNDRLAEQVEVLAKENADLRESLRKSEKISEILSSISHAARTTGDLNDLFKSIHSNLMENLDATNFYIALIDEEQERLKFPYYMDERDGDIGVQFEKININDPTIKSPTLAVIRGGKPILKTKEQLEKTGITGFGEKSAVWLGVPLMINRKVIGAMVVQHYSNPDHYSEKDFKLMISVSEQVAIAIDQKKKEETIKKLNEDLEKRVYLRTAQLEATNQKLEQSIAHATMLAKEAKEALDESKKTENEIVHINKVLQTINSTLDLDAVLKAVRSALKEIFDFDQIGVLLIDEKRDKLQFTKGIGNFNDEQIQKIQKIEFSLNETDSVFVRTVKKNRRIFIPSLNNSALSNMFEKDRKAYLINSVKGIILLPLRVQNRVIGLLTIANSQTEFVIGKKIQRKIQRYVNQVATAFNNARLSEETKRSLSETRKKEQEIAHLNRVVQAVNSTLDIDEIMKSVLNALQDNFRFDQVGIFLADEKKENLIPIKYYGKGVTQSGFEKVKKVPFPLRKKVSYVCETFILKRNFYFSPVTSEMVKSFMPTDKILFDVNPVKSYLLYPLQVQHKAIGTIVFASIHEQFDLNEGQINTIQQYVSQIANAVQNARLYSDLEKARHVAEAATKSKSRFLADMSHEIRTPMNAIIGLSGLALKHAISPKLADYLKKIDSSAHTLLGIINDILDFSKIEAGKMSMEELEFQLKDVLESVSNLIGIKCEERGLQLNFQIDELVPSSLIGDPLRLTQVLINLANNAVKFTEKGHITLGISIEHCLNNYFESVCLRFAVSDTGIGMTHKQIGRMFKSFSQADKSISRRFGGSGLGLAISKYIVEMMGGYIWVDSEYGQGSTFSFTATFKKCSKTSSRQYRTQKEAFDDLESLKDTNILVVEDNEINRLVATELLEAEGAIVTTVTDGMEALELLKELSENNYIRQIFDAVLMDVRMPKMDGYETTHAIRMLEKEKQNSSMFQSGSSNIEKRFRAPIPIIAMTAHAIVGEKKKCLNAGMNDFITKPINPQTLYCTLKKWLDTKSRENRAHYEKKVEIQGPVLPDRMEGLNIRSGLEKVADNISTYQTILKKFLNKYQTVDAEIEAAVKGKDIQAAILKAHSIKSVVGNIGAENLYEIANALEMHLIEGPSECYTFLLKTFSNELVVVIGTIEQLMINIEQAITLPLEPEYDDNGVEGDDFSKIGDLLLKMSRLLGVDLIETKFCLKELKHILGHSTEVMAFETALDEYDYDSAIARIDQIAKKFNISLSKH